MQSIAMVVGNRLLSAEIQNARNGEAACPVPRAKALVSLGLEDLFTAVVSGRADVMPHMHFTGGGLDRELGLGQKIVRTMHAALRGRFLVLLDCHG